MTLKKGPTGLKLYSAGPTGAPGDFWHIISNDVNLLQFAKIASHFLLENSSNC
jgi:hypothetical protein